MLKISTPLIAALLLNFSLTHAAEQAPGSDAETTSPTDFALVLKPRWEVGLGGGYVDDFDYPASSDPNRAGLLLPFVIYRGSNMRFSGRNVTAVAFEDPRFRVDISFGAALSANSDGDGVRAGMPDLDFLVELGPQLIMRLADFNSQYGRTLMNWRNRLRAVFSTDFKSLDSRGWLFQTQLQATQRRVWGNPKVDAVATFNLTWATEKLHDYFYEVDPEFATANRTQFNADGGFLGANLFAGMAWRPRPQLRVFGGLRQGYFGGSANEESPLFETTASTGFAVGLVWTILQSKDSIAVLDDE